MKTINIYVNVFNTLEGAHSFYANHRTARLLIVKQQTGKKDFFVDITPKREEQIHIVWPSKYDILREKVNEYENKK